MQRCRWQLSRLKRCPALGKGLAAGCRVVTASEDLKYREGRIFMEREEALETTLGDLIVALTDETAQSIRNDQEIYKVVAFALADLLNRGSATTRRLQYWQ